ncbi:hypothetical protein [Goodfellowiella coeruleoviolacea]|uniref:Uncharacterized protein n=1 Tax=Goodfellowiella coeruleoviolacea TaxID=334858 RepID=A0AAE3KJU5_9PSEU|nr:hypothetical protein [Goodfellowiella coeruleoviolacea]MCP2170015.1 hypothetical protein [Goodfellowiella coeruleoviolacea]
MNDRYSAADSPELVAFGTVRGLGVTGIGAPGEDEHRGAIQALYAVGGPLLRGALPPLEGRWWVEDDQPPLTVPRERWRWHLFLQLPEAIESAQVDQVRAAVGLRGAARVQVVDAIRLSVRPPEAP